MQKDFVFVGLVKVKEKGFELLNNFNKIFIYVRKDTLGISADFGLLY